MDKLHPNLLKGTFGELLVQIRLLQHGVQAAPPIRDSGNDLIALKGRCCKSIQVKTTGCNDPVRIKRPNREYDILALVVLDPDGNGMDVRLDECDVFLIPKENLDTSYTLDELRSYSICQDYSLCQERVDALFQ
jgi:hypothetical protein